MRTVPGPLEDVLAGLGARDAVAAAHAHVVPPAVDRAGAGVRRVLLLGHLRQDLVALVLAPGLEGVGDVVEPLALERLRHHVLLGVELELGLLALEHDLPAGVVVDDHGRRDLEMRRGARVRRARRVGTGRAARTVVPGAYRAHLDPVLEPVGHGLAVRRLVHAHAGALAGRAPSAVDLDVLADVLLIVLLGHPAEERQAVRTLVRDDLVRGVEERHRGVSAPPLCRVAPPGADGWNVRLPVLPRPPTLSREGPAPKYLFRSLMPSTSRRR